MSLVLRLIEQDRDYELPDDEARALIHELRQLAELDTLSHPSTLACLSSATILSVAFEGRPMPDNVGFTESEERMIDTCVALLVRRGKAGPMLKDMRYRLFAGVRNSRRSER
jgi:hypothetical protein